jgi:hypothetical protein
MKNIHVSWNVVLILFIALLIAPAIPADTSPPDNPVKLVFIHHSVGENWLSDDNGGLGKSLGENNYFVSDTYYGWGPDSIGDRTDIPDWMEWFTGQNRDTYMDAVFTEYHDDAAGYDYYNRPMTDPGGENRIILFKSCYPNSNLAGNPGDPVGDSPDLSVGGAKYVYTRLLEYFRQHPEKLFIAITPPPEISPEYAESAEAFSRWMVEDWLDSYQGTNAGVFDLHAVLSSPDNHHTAEGDTVVYTTGHGNTLAYPTGDPHPSKAGNIKATREFVPLLNYYYNHWKGGNPSPRVTDRPVEPVDTPDAPTPGEPTDSSIGIPISSSDGETLHTDGGKIGGSWVTYDDGDSTISLSTGEDPSSFCVETTIVPGGWATVETLSDEPEDWSAYSGISYVISAEREGIPYSLVLYAGEGREEKTGYSVSKSTGPVNTGAEELISIPWSEFPSLEGEGVFNPDISRGLFFSFEGGDADPLHICISNVSLTG